MKIKVFGKKTCAKCETTKNKFSHFLEKNNFKFVNLEFYDMDTIDGMAEGAYHDVLKIPTSIIEKEGKVLAKWEEEIPKTGEFKRHFEKLHV